MALDTAERTAEYFEHGTCKPLLSCGPPAGGWTRIGSALSGQVYLTSEFGNLGSRTITQFEFHADFGGGRIRPSAELRVPFGRPVEGFTSSVVGLSLAFFP
jgi:hypothetical protein